MKDPVTLTIMEKERDAPDASFVTKHEANHKLHFSPFSTSQEVRNVMVMSPLAHSTITGNCLTELMKCAISTLPCPIDAIQGQQ